MGIPLLDSLTIIILVIWFSRWISTFLLEGFIVPSSRFKSITSLCIYSTSTMLNMTHQHSKERTINEAFALISPKYLWYIDLLEYPYTSILTTIRIVN